MHLLQSVKESCSKHPNGQAAPAEASSVGETSSSQKMVLTSRRNIALMTGRHAEHWSSQPTAAADAQMQTLPNASLQIWGQNGFGQKI